MTTPVVVLNCPLCSWSLTIHPISNEITLNTLAEVFGQGIMYQQAINQRNQETEKALTTHLTTHPLTDWVRAIRDLQEDNKHLQAEVTILRGSENVG